MYEALETEMDLSLYGRMRTIIPMTYPWSKIDNWRQKVTIECTWEDNPWAAIYTWDEGENDEWEDDEEEDDMSIVMEEDIKRWTAKRKTALVLEIIQGKTTVAEASRSFDLPPSEVEDWVDEAKRGMENALRAKPLEIKEQYERQVKELQEAYGEAMLELRARKKLQSLLGEDEK